MIGFIRNAAVGAVALAAVAGVQSTANAAIIGQANYDFSLGVFGAGSGTDLALKLDGTTIFTVNNAASQIGNAISLATVAPGAFAALVAILRDGLSNDISTEAFNLVSVPGNVTISDFAYSPPANDDLQGNGAITDIVLLINSFDLDVFAIPGLGTVSFAEYNVDITVEAVPVPGAILSGVSALALMGLLAARRKRVA
jgi:hypothetical protein